MLNKVNKGDKMKITYSSELKQKLNSIVQKAFVDYLKNNLCSTNSIDKFYNKIMHGCKNLSFENELIVTMLAKTNDTLIIELTVCQLDSVFLHCYIRQGHVYCVMYSTYDDAQVELLKIIKEFSNDSTDKLIELQKLRDQNLKLIHEKALLQRKLDAYNSHDLINNLQDIINKVKEYEGDNNGN